MYLKSKLNHCCYLTVTVNLLLSVIYWRSGERAAPVYSRVMDPPVGEGRREEAGSRLSPYVLSKSIFCTETQKCSVHFYNKRGYQRSRSAVVECPTDLSLSHECADHWRWGTIPKSRGRRGGLFLSETSNPDLTSLFSPDRTCETPHS